MGKLSRFHACLALVVTIMIVACQSHPQTTSTGDSSSNAALNDPYAQTDLPTPTDLKPDLSTRIQNPERIEQLNNVPQKRLDALKRGVNVTRWFRSPLGGGEAHFHNYLGAKDFQILKDYGITSIRLALDPTFFIQTFAPEKINPLFLGYLDHALDKLIDQKFVVVLDIHDEDKKSIETDDQYVEAFVIFWGAFAKHMSKRDPDQLIFEIMNEPVFTNNATKWHEIQKRVATKIRENAPRHTIVATGTDWGGIDGLLKLAPLDDKNVIYSFHFYEPFWFTHQGATWSDENVRAMKSLPYPSSPSACKNALENIEGAQPKAIATAYCFEGWNAAKLEARLKLATDWGKKNAAPVWMGEFGVYTPVTPKEDRLRWFRDMRGLFDKLDLTWCAWGYDDVFTFGRKVDGDGNITLDTDAAKALGLVR